MNRGCAVFGIGNPLIDFVYNAEFSFLEKLNVKPGTMNLLSEDEKDTLIGMLPEYTIVPGGSCANTLRGLAWLSRYDNLGGLVYSGAVGNDEKGKNYVSMMENDFSIRTFGAEKEMATGFSISIVTPDFERTMFTYLGACRGYSPEDIHVATLEDSEVLHFNGYMWDTENQKKALKKAIQHAREKGTRVSFDVADPSAVERYKEDFLELTRTNVDILFGNMEELSILLGIENTAENRDSIVQKAGKLCPLVILKAGAEGCYIIKEGKSLYAPGKKVTPRDTVGAGDSFAAGFLYGYLKGYTLEETASLANSLAANIVTVAGCDYTKLNYENVME